MVKLLLVCLSVLYVSYVEGMGPCASTLEIVLKRYKVYPISRVANTTVCVDYVSSDEFDSTKYDAVDVRFRPVIENFVNVEITERKDQEIVRTTKDLKVYQPEPTSTSTFVNYPKTGVNTTTVSFECVEGSGILITYTCGYGNGGPTLFMSSVRNGDITPEDYETCSKIADELASSRSSVQFCPLDVSHCRRSR